MKLINLHVQVSYLCKNSLLTTYISITYLVSMQVNKLYSIIICTGGWKSDHRHGYGRHYSINEKTLYEGYYFLGRREGLGVSYGIEKKLKYIAEYRLDKAISNAIDLRLLLYIKKL